MIIKALQAGTVDRHPAIIQALQVGIAGGQPVVLPCPGCGAKGTFTTFPDRPDLFVNPDRLLGQRVCPNLECRCHVFVVRDLEGNVLQTYTPLRIDFDPQGIPQAIVTSFSDALSCHAEGIHVAAAIMIRRTLEELCEDKKAQGKTLKDRIGALRGIVVLPTELFSALDDLRLLGNDAAHIEAKTYNTIGSAELDAAFELTKEILKAVYQFDALLGKLQALKKS